MKVQIKRIDTDLDLPKYESNGAVGFDFICRESVEIPSKSLALIPANIIVKTPPGYALIIASRSSTARKKGLILANGIGVVDQDYCGPEDEIRLSVYNVTEETVTVDRGDRIAQGLFMRVDKAEFEEIQTIQDPTRGGFGTTG